MITLNQGNNMPIKITMLLSIYRSMVYTLTIISFSLFLHGANSSDFSDLFSANWASDHIVSQENHTVLYLDSSTGCGFESKKKYLFGKTSAQIKLVQGDSAGTVTAFYMSSEGPSHDELDFEFLGNVSGEPYIVQTNLYINGTGNREQRHYLWFDPTSDFHTYAFLWNRRSILFLVDDIPIREFPNKEKKGGVPYPKNQIMSIRGSLWNADDWATQGGRIKTNWSHSPFTVTFRSFEIDACEIEPNADELSINTKCGRSGQFWWDKPVVKEVNKQRRAHLKWARDKFLVYDYCQDVGRFSVDEMPKECKLLG